MLRTFDLDKAGHVCHVSYRSARRIDWHEGIPCPVHYKRRCGYLAKCQMRLDIEDLVKQRSPQLESWRPLEIKKPQR